MCERLQRVLGSLGPRHARLCAVLVALLVVALRARASRDFCLDDAWTHLAYAKSLRLGDGLSYNPGDHETGFSSPLWVLLLALLPWSANDPVPMVKCLGAILHALLALGSVRLTEQLCETRADTRDVRPLLAGLGVACDPFLAFSAVSGMEVSLAAALLVWASVFSLRAAPLSSFVSGCACVWARPETLFVLGPWAVWRWATQRRRADLWLGLGALTGLGVWVGYCLLVSGYPWPNTYYAKQGTHAAKGLLYYALQVLPEQVWLVGVSGAVLLVRGALKLPAARPLVVAWLVSIVATALTRDLWLGPQFYFSRYFAIACALPWIVIACGFPERTRMRVLVLAPLLLAGVWLTRSSYATQKAQEADIRQLHVEPARWLSTRLPASARIAVEGAGTMRFFLPRSITVLDILGLNRAEVVHAGGQQAALCMTVRAAPTHVALPDDQLPGFQQTLRLVLNRTFVDAQYSTLLQPTERRLYVASVLGVSDSARELCATR